jgi:hypothetical protein
MNTVIIDQEIDKLYNLSLTNPQIISSYFVENNENYICEVETYVSLEGNGFRVVGNLKEGGKTYIRIKNHGPDVIVKELGWNCLYPIILQKLN